MGVRYFFLQMILLLMVMLFHLKLERLLQIMLVEELVTMSVKERVILVRVKRQAQVLPIQ